MARTPEEERAIFRQSRRLHASLGLAAGAVLCIGAWLVDQSESRKSEAVRREHVQTSLSAVRAGLEMAVNERIHLARGLEALAITRPHITQEDFVTFARVLQGRETGIRSLQLARDGVVSHIYPLAGNEAARGHSLLADPAVAETALRAIQTREMLVAGPYTLRQGGEALVARMPVFTASGAADGAFWGFASVLIDFDEMLDHAGVKSLADTELAIRGKNGRGGEGEVFHGRPELFGDGRSVVMEISIPNGRWLLAGAPAGGWRSGWPGRQWLYAALGLMLLTIPLVVHALRRASMARIEAERLGLRDRLLNSLGEGVYGIDSEGRCTFINPAALRLLERTREEVVGAEAAALFGGPRPSRDHPEASDGEDTFRRSDGTTFPARVTVSPLERSQGCVIAFSDITERRQAGERLRLAASVFAHTQQGIMITDADGNLLDVNPAFTEITGYAREEVIGRNPRLLSSGRQGADFYGSLKQSLAETGFWRGEIWNRHKSGRAYPELLSIAAVDDGRGGVSHFIGVFSDISRQKQHEAELARIAHYDALTGLPNRVLLMDRLAQSLDQARRNKTRVAVCMLDLDRFKEVDQRYGHDTGDAVLVEVAHRLKAAVRSGDTVARLGGDEFVLLMLNVDGIAACEHNAHRMLKALSAPVFIDGQEIAISASLGMTLFPDDASDGETLLRHADQVMYAAKQEGRNRYRMFDPERDRQARHHRETLERISQALAAGEFRLHYQPKVDMRAGRIVGFEALVRWQHPVQGLLGPAEFLPVVAGTDLDTEIGRWVIGEALAQLSTWRAMGLQFGVSVNVSGAHLLTPGFAEELQSVLASHPLVERNAVEIEVLETAALTDLEAATVVLRRCLQLGASVALDDFGTGYSSLAYFRRLPVKTLKIDQMFVRDMLRNADDMAIVEGIVRFAKAFNRQIVAEGVETADLCVPLLALGCEIGQGHGIAPAMPAERVPEWARNFMPDPAWAVPAESVVPI